MTKQAEIEIDEGRYVINVQALKKDEDEPSAMASVLSQSVVITKQEGMFYVTLMFLDHKTVTGFQMESPNGEWIESFKEEASEKTNMRFEMFELSRLATPLNARVQYEAEYEGNTFKGDEALRLSFDEESLKEAE